MDPHDKEGTNRTGIYSLKMILDSEMPEIIPLEGLRVKLQYQGVERQCNLCFGKHNIGETGDIHVTTLPIL